tara:strand:- start:3018 stop:4409 length:1392 start_codon:yes stop_codon:yes gene_type:complete
MASTVNPNVVVEVNVSALGAGSRVDRFGIPLIVDTQNIKSATALAPVIGTYYSLAEMAAAGFATYTKAYKLAAQIFRQRKPNPRFFKVASVYAVTDAELSAVESADPAFYYLLATSLAEADIELVSDWVQTVAEGDYLYLCDSFDTDNFSTSPSIKSLLASADSSKTALGCRKVDPQTLTLTISAPFVASNSVVVSVNGVALSPTVFATDSNTTLAALATALQATTAIASATVTNAGGGTDDDRVIVIVADDPLIDVVLTGYACSLGASQNTAAIATTDAGAKPWCASAVGYLCSFPAGSANLAGKTLVGIDGDSCSTTDYNRVTSFGANIYTPIGSRNGTRNGQTSGEIANNAFYFVDTIIAIARLKAEMQEAIIDLLAQDPKLPYNQNGINAVALTIASVAQQFVTQGILEPFDTSTAINVPALASVPAGDRTARHLPGITAQFTGTGAIQSTDITITVVE